MRGVLHPSFVEKCRHFCRDCGGVFMALPNRDYCDECRWLVCARCDKKFLPKEGNHKQQYCSRHCAAVSGIKLRRMTIKKARNAQRLVSYYVGCGRLVRPTECEECGKHLRIEASHYNYNEPLRVRWLCRSCHVKWDKMEPKGVTYAVAVWSNN